jgi:Trk K+ transport system NAD-binding subunit
MAAQIPTPPGSGPGSRWVVAVNRRLVSQRQARAVQRKVRSDQLAGHIVVYGLTRVGRRAVEELLRLGETVVAAERGDRYDSVVTDVGIPVVRCDLRTERGMLDVALPTAKALLLCADDDLGNLQVALAAPRLNPGLRMVVRMFRLELGRRIEQEIPGLVTVSNSRLVAPAFVGAALRDDWRQRLAVRDRELVLDLANTARDGLTLPGTGTPITLAPAPPPVPVKRHGGWAGVAGRVLRELISDRRLRVVTALIAVLVAVSTLVFQAFTPLGWFGALYAAMTEVATTGLDPSISGASGAVRAYAVVLLFAAALLLAAVYALFTDTLVSVRISRALGGVPRRMRDHVIVCGLGAVGLRIAERLAAGGLPVAAVELSEDGTLLLSARRQGIAAVVGDARFPSTLREVHCDRAKAVVLATRDDLTNLEAALMLRREFPHVRIVMRMYSAELADRAQRLVPEAAVLSTAALAAPAFAANALGPDVVGTLECDNRLFVVVEAPVDADTTADGCTVAALERGGLIRVLGIADGDAVRWQPAADAHTRAGDVVIAVTAPGGLSDLLTLVRGGPPVTDMLAAVDDPNSTVPTDT